MQKSMKTGNKVEKTSIITINKPLAQLMKKKRDPS